MRLHLHLVSDSTGETLEALAKACVAQFEGVEAIKHYWPMVRSEGHVERVISEIDKLGGLVLYTLVNSAVRERLESRCRQLGIATVSVLDPVLAGLSRVLGQTAKAVSGRQHMMDAAYYARIDAINYTMSHDDGAGADDWEEADIILAGVSRSCKTPTSIYLANRGYRVANIPIVPQSPPPPSLFSLRHPLVVGLTTSSERLVQVRRNRILVHGQATTNPYVDPDRVAQEIAYARRMYADKGWPVIDVTRRSIEETASAVINLLQEWRGKING